MRLKELPIYLRIDVTSLGNSPGIVESDTKSDGLQNASVQFERPIGLQKEIHISTYYGWERSYQAYCKIGYIYISILISYKTRLRGVLENCWRKFQPPFYY